MDSILKAKKAAAKAAVELVEDGMLIGLGSGTTASYFIESLIEKCRQGFQIQVVATSLASERLAASGGIPFANINEISSLHICFDGADEIDPHKRMIKGGGGALLKEKIVASMSKKMVVLVDESKCVSVLGKFPLAVEIVSFAYHATISKLQSYGYHGVLRKKDDESFYITDCGNYIFDVHLSANHPPPEIIHETLINITGVIETGFFFQLATQVIVGKVNGEVEIIT